MEFKHSYNVFFIIFLIFFSSCDSYFYSENYSYDSNWNVKKSAKFSVYVDDIESNYSIFFIIRNNKSYPYSNLFLCIDYNNKKDTIQYDLADKKSGRWLGSGLFIKEIEALYKENFKFKEKGIYTFFVSHGMGVNKLEGIESIGMKIVKAKLNL